MLESLLRRFILPLGLVLCKLDLLGSILPLGLIALNIFLDLNDLRLRVLLAKLYSLLLHGLYFLRRFFTISLKLYLLIFLLLLLHMQGQFLPGVYARIFKVLNMRVLFV